MLTPDPMEVVSGTSEAEAFVVALRSNLGTGDELYHWLRTMKQGPNDDRLRGACRHLQKMIERAR
jgi:hypothetical protein